MSRSFLNQISNGGNFGSVVTNSTSILPFTGIAYLFEGLKLKGSNRTHLLYAQLAFVISLLRSIVKTSIRGGTKCIISFAIALSLWEIATKKLLPALEVSEKQRKINLKKSTSRELSDSKKNILPLLQKRFSSIMGGIDRLYSFIHYLDHIKVDWLNFKFEFNRSSHRLKFFGDGWGDLRSHQFARIAAISTLSGDSHDPLENLETLSNYKINQNQNQKYTKPQGPQSYGPDSPTSVEQCQKNVDLLCSRALPVIAGSSLRATKGNFLLTDGSGRSRKVTNQNLKTQEQQFPLRANSMAVQNTNNDNSAKNGPNDFLINRSVTVSQIEQQSNTSLDSEVKKSKIPLALENVLENFDKTGTENAICWEKIRRVGPDVVSRRGCFTSPIADYYDDSLQRDQAISNQNLDSESDSQLPASQRQCLSDFPLKTCHFMLVAAGKSDSEDNFLQRFTEHPLMNACFANLIGTKSWKTKRHTLRRNSKKLYSDDLNCSLDRHWSNYHWLKYKELFMRFFNSFLNRIEFRLKSGVSERIIGLYMHVVRLREKVKDILHSKMVQHIQRKLLCEAVAKFQLVKNKYLQSTCPVPDIIVESADNNASDKPEPCTPNNIVSDFSSKKQSQSEQLPVPLHQRSRNSKSSSRPDPSTLIVLFPATGEQSYILNLPLAASLARDHGYCVLLLTAPYYGRRKPESQRLHYIRTVSDFMKQNFGTQVEASFITRIFGGVMAEMQLEKKLMSNNDSNKSNTQNGNFKFGNDFSNKYGTLGLGRRSIEISKVTGTQKQISVDINICFSGFSFGGGCAAGTAVLFSQWAERLRENAKAESESESQTESSSETVQSNLNGETQSGNDNVSSVKGTQAFDNQNQSIQPSFTSLTPSKMKKIDLSAMLLHDDNHRSMAVKGSRGVTVTTHPNHSKVVNDNSESKRDILGGFITPKKSKNGQGLGNKKSNKKQFQSQSKTQRNLTVSTPTNLKVPEFLQKCVTNSAAKPNVDFRFSVSAVPYASANNCAVFCEGQLENDVDWNSLRLGGNATSDSARVGSNSRLGQCHSVTNTSSSNSFRSPNNNLSASSRCVLNMALNNSELQNLESSTTVQSPFSTTSRKLGSSGCLRPPSPTVELLTDSDCKQKLWHFLMNQDLNTMVDTVAKTHENKLLHRVHCVSFENDGFIPKKYGLALYESLSKLAQFRSVTEQNDKVPLCGSTEDSQSVDQTQSTRQSHSHVSPQPVKSDSLESPSLKPESKSSEVSSGPDKLLLKKSTLHSSPAMKHLSTMGLDKLVTVDSEETKNDYRPNNDNDIRDTLKSTSCTKSITKNVNTEKKSKVKNLKKPTNDHQLSTRLEWKAGGHLWAFLRKNSLQKEAIVETIDSINIQNGSGSK